jgi:hypothetical protein
MEKVLDIDKKEIQLGHILAVRYVWNSYAGIVTIKGLHVGGRYHQIENNATYQIIGHTDNSHPDYNKDVSEWINLYLTSKDYGECPVKIRVYENAEFNLGVQECDATKAK